MAAQAKDCGGRPAFLGPREREGASIPSSFGVPTIAPVRHLSQRETIIELARTLNDLQGGGPTPGSVAADSGTADGRIEAGTPPG